MGIPSWNICIYWRKLELGPDEVIKLTSDDDDIIVYGTMVVNTTAEHPAVITSFSDNEYGYAIGSGAPEKGDWGSIHIKPAGTAVLDHAMIRYGGHGYGLVYVEEGGNLTLQNSTLEHSSGRGYM